MILRNNIFGILLAIILPLTLVTGCDETSTDATGTTGTLEILLHDAPANYEKVNVFIERVEVNNTQNDETGWIEISSPEQTYDLLELTNGATEVLGSAELEPGTYEQIRLILGQDGHNIIADGTTQDLFVPSGQQTGIKLNVNAEIKPDITYTLLLDFDASRSVVKAGKSGKYLLKPVISATNEATTGNIAGAIDPANSKPFVYAITDSDTLSSTKADTTDGSFKLIGLVEGTYTVSVDPTNSSYQQKDTTGIEVTTGQTNDIGTVELPQN